MHDIVSAIFERPVRGAVARSVELIPVGASE